MEMADPYRNSFDPYAGKPWALVARGAKDRIIRSRRRDLSV